MLHGCTTCGGCRPQTPCECLACKGFPPLPIGIGAPVKPPHDCQMPLYVNVLTEKLHFWDHVTGQWECAEACSTSNTPAPPSPSPPPPPGESGRWSMQGNWVTAPQTLRLDFNRDGTTTRNATTPGASPNWADTPGATVGDGFWIKALTRAHAPGGGAESLTTGFWMQLSETRSWYIGRNTEGTAGVTIDFYLATAPNDSAIVKEYEDNVWAMNIQAV